MKISRIWQDRIAVFLYTINPFNYYRVSHGHERRISRLEQVRDNSALSPVEIADRVGKLEERMNRISVLLSDCSSDITKLRKEMFDAMARR